MKRGSHELSCRYFARVFPNILVEREQDVCLNRVREREKGLNTHRPMCLRLPLFCSLPIPFRSETPVSSERERERESERERERVRERESRFFLLTNSTGHLRIKNVPQTYRCLMYFLEIFSDGNHFCPA